MNIQIYGKTKCFDTKKAERWFKERRVKYQFIDLPRFGMGRRELEAARSALGLPALFDEKAADYDLLRYLAHDADKFEKLLEDPTLIRTPLVRNGRKFTVGFAPEVWKDWD